MSSRDAIRITLADEAEFNELVSGAVPLTSEEWPKRYGKTRVQAGRIAVLWHEVSLPRAHAKPIAFVISEDEERRVFGRFAQVRSDLSPLSAWCHILSPDLFERVHQARIEPELCGYDACWAGLAIAEAAMLASRQTSALKLASCLTTQTFAIARTVALWGARPLAEVFAAYDSLQSCLRSATSPATQLRERLAPVWQILVNLAGGKASLNGDEADVLGAILALQDAKRTGLDAHLIIANAFSHVASTTFLRNLHDLTPEQRLREFDKLIAGLSDVDQRSGAATRLSFIAGYLATIAAGGSASLKLAENVAARLPQVTAWAYVIGGLGEAITWTSSFDGLGRLVARELQRPFDLDEPPVADFDLREAAVLIDRQLADPLVHLRIKQARTITVALFPGVNIISPLHEMAFEATQHRNAPEPTRRGAGDPVLETLAQALLPHLAPHIENLVRERESRKETTKVNRKASQRKLI